MEALYADVGTVPFPIVPNGARQNKMPITFRQNKEGQGFSYTDGTFLYQLISARASDAGKGGSVVFRCKHHRSDCNAEWHLSTDGLVFKFKNQHNPNVNHTKDAAVIMKYIGLAGPAIALAGQAIRHVPQPMIVPAHGRDEDLAEAPQMIAPQGLNDGRVDELQSELNHQASNNKILELSGQLSDNNTLLDKYQQKLAKLQELVDRLSATLTNQIKRRKEVEENLARRQGHLNDAVNALNAEKAKVLELEAEIGSIKSALSETMEALEQERAKLYHRLETENRNLRRLRGLQVEKNGLEVQVESLENQIFDLKGRMRDFSF